MPRVSSDLDFWFDGHDMQTLVTISFSHYCEKARWVLDLVGTTYKEESHLPLFHFAPVALATRGAKDKGSDSVSSPFSTPVLITESGERICDSTRIMQHLSGKHELGLYDDDDALTLDAKFSQKLGPHTRRFGYHYLLDDSKLLRKFFWAVGSKGQAAGAVLMRPLYSRIMRKALGINAASAQRSRGKVASIAAEVEERLADGRPYLCGDRFTSADLSYAALMAPSLLLTSGEGYGSEFPSMEEVGGEPAAFARELRSRRAGTHAMEIYRKHRGLSAALR